MTIRAKQFAVGLSLTTGIIAGLVGCGGDDPESSDPGSTSGGATSSSSSGTNSTSSSSGGSSGTTSSSSSGNPGNQPFTRALTAVYAADFAPIAFTADELDDGAPVTWALTTVPGGSAAIAPSGTPLVFRPDLPGAYTLTATGTYQGAPRTGTLTLEAVEAQTVAFQLTHSGAGQPGRYGVRAGGSIVGPAHDVGCVRQSASITTTENNNFGYAWSTLATWYGPAGTPTRVVYGDSPFGSNDGGTMTSLVAGSTDGTCDGAAAVKALAPLGSIPQARNPAFNADGSRIAFVGTAADKRTIFSVPYDGSEAPFAIGPIENAYGRPAWLPDGTLASTNYVDGTHFEIHVFADKVALPQPLPAAWMTCEGGIGSEATFAFLDATHIVIGYTAAGVNGIRVVHPDAATRACVVDQTIVESTADLTVHDQFSLSPSKKKIAFNATAGGANHVYVAPVDGSSPAQALNAIFAAAPDAGLDAMNGSSVPNWLGSDQLLSWANDAAVVTARVDGTPIAAGAPSRVVDTTADPNTSFVTSGITGLCSVGVVGAGGGGGALLCALGVLAARRRRRH